MTDRALPAAGHGSIAKSTRNWLRPQTGAWVVEHQDALDAIYESFHGSGEWPDPVQRQRELRADGRRIALTRAVNSMPRELGWRAYNPDRVVLSLFGIACCAGSRHLLGRYLEVLHLALKRHDQPALENRLTRDEVVAELNLKLVEADRLSKMLVRGCPFLAGGASDPASWDLAIDERIVDFEDVESIDDFLLILAKQQFGQTSPVPAVPEPTAGPVVSPQELSLPPARSSVPNPVPALPADPPRDYSPKMPVLAAVSIALGLGGTVLTYLDAPLIFSAPVLAACLLSAVVFYVWPYRRRILAVAVTFVAVACGVAGSVVLLTDPEASHTGRLLSLGEQLDEVSAQAAREGRYAISRRQAFLHGVTRSHLLVLRDEYLRDRFRTDISSPVSDEIRIYDEVDGDLRLRFRFQPQNPGEIQQRPEGDHPSFLFRLRSIDDFDRNGNKEIVGTFDRYTLASGPYSVPVLISWDDGAGQYQIGALIPDQLDLEKPRGLGTDILDGYLVPTVIQNQHGDQTLKGHAADEFEIVRAPRAPVLMAAFGGETPAGVGSRYEAKAWWLDLQTPVPRHIECAGTLGRHRFIRIEFPGQLRVKMRHVFLARGSPKGCREA